MKRLFHFSLFLLATLVSLTVAYLLLDWPSSADVTPFALVNYHQASQVQAAQLSLGSEFTVCTTADGQESPAIYGDIVVWEDDRSGTDDIYGYDLSTKQEFTVCTATGHQVLPAIYGNVVVWQDRRSGTDTDIYGYDLNTGEEFTVSTAAGNQAYSAIHGSLVVWRDDRDYVVTGYDIYGYDLATKQEFTVCTDMANQYAPAIYGNFVVWEDWRGANIDIYGYDLSTGQEFPVCTAVDSQWDPAIYGNVVVWEDRRSGTDTDIYGYDLSTGQEFTVCTETHNQYAPAIYGHVVVWRDRRGTDDDIYGYDLSTGQEFTICTATGYQSRPAIYGHVVVWWDERSYGMTSSDIYGAWLLTDLSAFKAVDVVTTTRGGTLAYTIVLSNSGSVPSFFTHLTDTVPVSTTYVTGSVWASFGTTEEAGNEIRWRGVISAGLAVTVTYQVTVSSTVAPGDLITNSAYVDDGYAPFWTNVVTTTVGNIEVNLPVIMKN